MALLTAQNKNTIRKTNNNDNNNDKKINIKANI